MDDDDRLMLRILSVAAAAIVHAGTGHPATDVLEDAKVYEAHALALEPPAA